MSNEIEWTFATDTWVCGEDQFGCGVYEENHLWWFNLVHDEVDLIECFGPFETLEIAKQQAEQTYLKLKNKETT
jgi:hypothetical protein